MEGTDDNNDVTMEEQTVEDNEGKNPSQQESAYGSLESSSNGQSQKSYSGSKSLNSGSSHSSGFGDQGDFRLKDSKHKDHKRKKSKEKIEKPKEKVEKSAVEEKMKEDKALCTVSQESKARDNKEPVSIAVSEDNSATFNCQSNSGDDQIVDQPSIVYTQALNYIRKIKERSAEQGVPFASPDFVHLPSDKQDVAAFLKNVKSARGFTVAISIQDGTVLQVSPSITDVLGYPKDMLLGQSFIDFVYPKDSINFSSKIIHGLNMPFRSDSMKDNFGPIFYCRLRMYHGLKNSGFGVRNKPTYYIPCKIILKFHDVSSMDETASTCGPNSSLLLAEIIPIEKAYKVPEETPAMGSFSIRHSASCNFSEYDIEAIPYLGHLPQDLTGNSVFDCYHPEDLPMLKNVYKEIVKEQGKPYRSKPYRFRTFNGGYAILETEWLCFVNPWTKKIDSIIGQHRVLKGPRDISIYLDPCDKNMVTFSEEVMKEAQKAQSEIVELLSKPVASYKDPSKEPSAKRRRTLAHMMSSIVEELDHMEKSKPVCDGPDDAKTLPEKKGLSDISILPPPVPSFVNIGQESLNSSSETPSTYGHLNYTETIQRFFRSQPKTVSSDESGDSKMEVSQQESNEDEGKSSSPPETSTSGSGKPKSQSQSTGNGSGSGDNVYDSTRKSVSTGNGSSSRDREETLDCSYHHVTLTEDVLSKHNQDMQKIFLQRQKVPGKPGKGSKYKAKLKRPVKQYVERSQGVKRTASAMEKENSAQKNREMPPHMPHHMPPHVPTHMPPHVPPHLPPHMGPPHMAPSAESNSTLKPSSADYWSHMESGKSVPSTRPSSSVGTTFTQTATPSGNMAYQYSGIMPTFYLPSSTPSQTISQPVATMAAPPPVRPSPYQMPPVIMQQQQGYVPSPGVAAAVPVQYVGAYPGVVYQPVVPPLFNSPPLMLPNMVFQHTLVQPPIGHVPLPVHSDGERKSGAESEQELLEASQQASKMMQMGKPISYLMGRPDSQATSVKAEPGSARGSTASASGKVISSHSHAAESIRSYMEEPSAGPKDNDKNRDSSQVSQFSQSTSVLAEAESVGSPEKVDKLAVDEQEQRLDLSSDMVMSLSSTTYSSRGYKSTDDSLQNNSENSESNQGSSGNKWGRGSRQRPVLSDPPWLEQVKVTPELLYRYQLETKELVDVLRQDMEMLKRLRQPVWVDDQLASLYQEMELEGDSSINLNLEEGITSSSGEDQPGTPQENCKKKKRSSTYFSKMAMTHQENAPMPPPETSSSSSSSS